jgi:hypothetical protein
VRGRHGVRPTRGLATGPAALPPGLRSGGWLYLTVELAPGDRVRAANQAARRLGLPVVDGEIICEGPDGYYHHYPSMGQVRTWLAGAGFTLNEEAEWPWHEEGMPTTAYSRVWKLRRRSPTADRDDVQQNGLAAAPLERGS